MSTLSVGSAAAWKTLHHYKSTRGVRWKLLWKNGCGRVVWHLFREVTESAGFWAGTELYCSSGTWIGSVALADIKRVSSVHVGKLQPAVQQWNKKLDKDQSDCSHRSTFFDALSRSAIFVVWSQCATLPESNLWCFWGQTKTTTEDINSCGTGIYSRSLPEYVLAL